MSNTRQAALDGLRKSDDELNRLGQTPSLTISFLFSILKAMRNQNIAMRRVFEYAEAVALEV